MKPEKGKKKEKAPSAAAKSPGSTGTPFITVVILNIAGVAAAVWFVFRLFNFPPVEITREAIDKGLTLDRMTYMKVQGYDWMLNTMLKSNIDTINKYPDLNIDQRYELKWGGKVGYGEIAYINRIKQQTPDSAIIIAPPRKLLTQVGFKSSAELPWLTYFVYPRQVVYEDDKDSSKLYARANYVLAVNGWGFDKLNYRVNNPQAFMILPLKK